MGGAWRLGEACLRKGALGLGIMLPIMLIKRSVKVKAVFPEDLITSSVETPGGFAYSVSQNLPFENVGRFYVSGTVTGVQIKGFISPGFVNGKEAMNGGAPLSVNPYVSGAGPYVCLKLTPAIALGDIKAEVLCKSGFGVEEDDYYHPLAFFRETGKVAQFAYFDYTYKPSRRAGRWIHHIVAS
jgi:hypothetical protein